MPTLSDYPGVSRIQQQSPGLPYMSPNLPDKIELWAFLCFNLEFIPFSPKIRIFYDSKFGFWGIFTRISSLTKSWKLIVMVCNSCKTSYNVLSWLGTGSNCAHGRGGVRGGWSLIFGGLMQKKESPDFRFPEVGISGNFVSPWKNLLMLINSKLHSKSCDYLYLQDVTTWSTHTSLSMCDIVPLLFTAGASCSKGITLYPSRQNITQWIVQLVFLILIHSM